MMLGKELRRASRQIHALGQRSPVARRLYSEIKTRLSPPRASWFDLERELDAWASAGKRARIWWRDDDATEATPALERLLACRREHGVPLALAVVPAGAQPALAARLAREDDVHVLQHGWAHENHSAPPHPKAEFGPSRAVSESLRDLEAGRKALDRIFGSRWLKVLVPPFNEIAPAVTAALPAAGYAGLSSGRPRRSRITALVQANAHVDLVDWSTDSFAGDEAVLSRAVAHLRAKRRGWADPDEPTGLLTHHLVHDEAACRFLDRLLSGFGRHPAVAFDDPAVIFYRRSG